MPEMHRFSRAMVNRRTGSRARKALAVLGPHLKILETDRVLELGSGGGGMIAQLHQRYHPVQLVGTDFDPAQVSAARAFLESQPGGVPASVELRTADASALPFEEHSFDYVFAMMMLHHVEAHFQEYKRRPQALSEIRRVLRPGGRLVYSEIFRREEIRGGLLELGFSQEFLRAGWRRDDAIYRTPSA